MVLCAAGVRAAVPILRSMLDADRAAVGNRAALTRAPRGPSPEACGRVAECRSG